MDWSPHDTVKSIQPRLLSKLGNSEPEFRQQKYPQNNGIFWKGMASSLQTVTCRFLSKAVARGNPPLPLSLGQPFHLVSRREVKRTRCVFLKPGVDPATLPSWAGLSPSLGYSHTYVRGFAQGLCGSSQLLQARGPR